MKREEQKFNKILSVKATDFQRVAGVTRDQAQKYKAGTSLPSLTRAVLFEDKFNIPPRLWVEFKKYMEEINVQH